MTKLLLALTSVCAGIGGFCVLYRSSERSLDVAAAETRQWQAATKRLAAEEVRVAALRDGVRDKRSQLVAARELPDMSPEMLRLLEGNTSGLSAAASAQLRQQLGIAWNSSPNYVLISKEAARRLNYDRLGGASKVGREASEVACDVLALSPDEQVAIRTDLRRFSEQSRQTLRVERSEPGGDIVAQYTVTGPDSGVLESLSSNFTAEVVSVVGQQRADLLLPDAWRQFQGDLSDLRAGETQTMTIRQTVVDGQPDLLCEIKDAQTSYTTPVRFAHYPSSWFLRVFPGGWQTVADREGFELPPHFEK
jgi:hypothetical protein